jgi:hypothetical protein
MSSYSTENKDFLSAGGKRFATLQVTKVPATLPARGQVTRAQNATSPSALRSGEPDTIRLQPNVPTQGAFGQDEM